MRFLQTLNPQVGQLLSPLYIYREMKDPRIVTNLQKREEEEFGRSPRRDKAQRNQSEEGQSHFLIFFPGILGIVFFFLSLPSIPPETHYQGKSSFLHCLLQRILAQEKRKWKMALSHLICELEG